MDEKGVQKINYSEAKIVCEILKQKTTEPEKTYKNCKNNFYIMKVIKMLKNTKRSWLIMKKIASKIKHKKQYLS